MVTWLSFQNLMYILRNFTMPCFSKKVLTHRTRSLRFKRAELQYFHKKYSIFKRLKLDNHPIFAFNCFNSLKHGSFNYSLVITIFQVKSQGQEKQLYPIVIFLEIWHFVQKIFMHYFSSINYLYICQYWR